jgi:hypothetical protein
MKICTRGELALNCTTSAEAAMIRPAAAAAEAEISLRYVQKPWSDEQLRRTYIQLTKVENAFSSSSRTSFTSGRSGSYARPYIFVLFGASECSRLPLEKGMMWLLPRSGLRSFA